MAEKKKIWISIGCLWIVGAALFYVYGYHWLKSVRYFALMGFLVVLGIVDWKRQVIPNRLLLAMFGLRGGVLLLELFLFADYRKEILSSALGGVLFGGGMFLFIYLLSRKNLGMGDVKLAGVLGWYLGTALFWLDCILSLGIAAAYCGVQLARKKLHRRDYIPMAPFFACGTIVLLMVGF